MIKMSGSRSFKRSIDAQDDQHIFSSDVILSGTGQLLSTKSGLFYTTRAVKRSYKQHWTKYFMARFFVFVFCMAF